MTQSLSDRMLELLVDLRRIEAKPDDPMRHCIRKCKVEAEQILHHAIEHAQEMIDLAKQIPADFQQGMDDHIGNSNTNQQDK